MLVRELLFTLGFDSNSAEKNAKRMDRVVDGLKKNLVRLGAVAGTAVIGLGALALRAGNDYQNMANKLKLVTEGSEELEKAQIGVYEAAQRARTGLSTLTDLYFGMANAAQDYGYSQERILRIAETTAKLGTMSGNDQASVNAALFQLRQGIGSGVLRGQELNSVLEQAKPVADAIAAGMGIPFKEIRAQAEKGKITGLAVLQALESQALKTDEQFAKMDRTAGQAKEQLKNAFGFFAGRTAKENDVVAAQVEFYDEIKKIIVDPAFQKLLVTSVKAISAIISGFGKLVNKVYDLATALTASEEAIRKVKSAFTTLIVLITVKAIPSIALYTWYFGGLAASAWTAAGGLMGVAGAVWAILWPLALISAAIYGLYKLIEDLYILFEGGPSVIRKFSGEVAEILTLLLWPIEKVYNGFVRLLNLFGADFELQDFSASLKEAIDRAGRKFEIGDIGIDLINKSGLFDTDFTNNSLLDVGRMSGFSKTSNQLSVVNNTPVTLNVPAGTNAEQANYITDLITKGISENTRTIFREAQSNFTEVE